LLQLQQGKSRTKPILIQHGVAPIILVGRSAISQDCSCNIQAKPTRETMMNHVNNS
jgi:hypothetical protein